MVAMPSGAVSRITSTGKWHVSSHSAACGAMRSLAKASAVSWIAACSSVRAKCMGSASDRVQGKRTLPHDSRGAQWRAISRQRCLCGGPVSSYPTAPSELGLLDASYGSVAPLVMPLWLATCCGLGFPEHQVMFRRRVRSVLLVDFDNIAAQLGHADFVDSIPRWLGWLEDGRFDPKHGKRSFIVKRMYWNTYAEPYRNAVEAQKFEAFLCPSKVK